MSILKVDEENKVREDAANAFSPELYDNYSKKDTFVGGYLAGYRTRDQGLTATVVRHLRDELAKKDETCEERVKTIKGEAERAGYQIMAMQHTIDNHKRKYSELMQEIVDKESKDIDIAGRVYIVGMDAHKNKVKVTIEQYLNALGEFQKKCREEEHPPMEELRRLIFDFEKVLFHIML